MKDKDLAEQFQDDIAKVLAKYNEKKLSTAGVLSGLSLHLCGITIGGLGDSRETKDFLNGLILVSWHSAKNMIDEAASDEAKEEKR